MSLPVEIGNHSRVKIRVVKRRFYIDYVLLNFRHTVISFYTVNVQIVCIGQSKRKIIPIVRNPFDITAISGSITLKRFANIFFKPPIASVINQLLHFQSFAKQARVVKALTLPETSPCFYLSAVQVF